MQLKMNDIFAFCGTLISHGMTMAEIKELPIYIGDDDELNGIHCAWYTNLVDANNTEDANFVDMINEDRCNIQLNEKAILIS